MTTKKTTTKKKDSLLAVIEITPRQYLVKVGDKFVTDKQDTEVGKKIIIDKVLLIHDGKKTTIGQSYISNASVELNHDEQKKGKKIRVARFRAKSRTRKVKGFRPQESHLTVTAIKTK